MCGEEAMRISPIEPYCLRRPIRRGNLIFLNIIPCNRYEKGIDKNDDNTSPCPARDMLNAYPPNTPPIWRVYKRRNHNKGT